jgi:hypothetical protein
MFTQEQTEKLMFDAVRDAIREGIKDKLSKSYDNPLFKLVEDCIKRRSQEISSIIDDAIVKCVCGTYSNFKEQFMEEAQRIIAKQLIAKFGGEIEKTVNVLKSDPSTRAKITLAVDDCVRNLGSK